MVPRNRPRPTMPLSLYVLRHAKAEDIATAGGDHERALKPRGREAAQLAGRHLTELKERPDLVLSSTALRAKETAELAKEAGGWNAPIEICPAIYEATAERLLEQLEKVEARIQRLLLVGHQPGLSLLIGSLTGNEPGFPTAALARIDLELERWSDVRARCGQLAWLITPKAIAALHRG